MFFLYLQPNKFKQYLLLEYTRNLGTHQVPISSVEPSSMPDVFLRIKILATIGNKDWHFGFETSRLPIFQGLWFRFRRIWSLKKSLGFSFGKFSLEKKVSVSVLESLVSEKKSRFWRIWSRKKLSVSENLVLKKKVFVLVLENLILEKKKSK